MNHRNNLIMREIMQEGGERRDRRLEKKKDRLIQRPILRLKSDQVY